MRCAAAFGLAVIAASSFTAPAFGAGLGASPDSIRITTTREGTGVATLIIFADGIEVREVEATVVGEASLWLSIDHPDIVVGTTRIAVGEDGRVSVTVTATVPPDAPNGEHTAAIEVTAVDRVDDINPSVVVPVVIDVTGDAVVSGTADLTMPERVGETESIPILTTVVNTGTVTAVPSISYTLSEDGNTFASGSLDNEAIAPGESGDLRLNIDHQTPAGSTVEVEVTVMLGEVVIMTSTQTVDVVETGNVSIGVTSVGMSLVEAANPGGVSRVTATFTNATSADVATVFRGQVTRDGSWIDDVESIRVLASPGATATVDLFVPIDDEGTYEVTGRWDGQAQSSEDATVAWTVGSSPRVSLLLAAAIISIVIIAILAVRFFPGRPSADSEGDRVVEQARR